MKPGVIGRLARALTGRAASRRDGVLLVTANFGGIDDVRPLPAGFGADACYYTDAAMQAATDPATAGSWPRFVVPEYPRHDFNARLRGRYFKHQIHRLPEAAGYAYLAWADSNVRWLDPGFLTGAADRLRRLPARKRVMLIRHPFRNTVREEFEYIAAEIAKGNEYLRLRYADEKMAEQMAFFAAQGWPSEAPLWCGTVWIVENSPLMNQVWDAWWDQNLRFGMMDQLSLPVLLAHFGIEPQDAEISLVDNAAFVWEQHRKLA